MNYKGNDKYGVLPRRTMIANQPHMLSYITPQEEMLLRQLGGTGQAGPMGVPAYPPGDGGFSPDGGGGYGGGGGFGGFGGSEGPGGGYNDAADAIAAAQQQAIDNAAAMAAADAAIAGQIEAAAQEEANAAAMAEAEAEAEAIAIQDPSGITNTSGATTTSIVGTSMFDNMRNLMAQEEAKNNIGSSGYVSVDAMADTTPDVGFIPDNFTPDLGGYMGIVDDDGLPNIDVNEGDFDPIGEPEPEPYAIDIQDTNIYTENPDGTYTVEDGEQYEPPANGGEPPANGGDGNGIDTTETTATTSIQDPAEYFNLRRSTAPSGWMSNSIWRAAGKGPDFDVDVYQDADGSLRFRETGELIPTEYLKYIDLARRTEMDAPEEDVA